jgi:hypothetical protein
MTRSAVWVFALVLGAARLCQAQELPKPSPLSKDKEPPAKAGTPLKAVKTADEQPKNPVPVLFPAPPYPPPAPAVVDPRTGAWEQITNPVEAEAEVAGPVVGCGPEICGGWPQARMAIRGWFYRFNHSGEGASPLDLSRDEHSSDWKLVEAKTGH